jgi:hypothetical protein
LNLLLAHHAHRRRHIDQALLDPVGPHHDLFNTRSRVGLIHWIAGWLGAESPRAQKQAQP